MGLEVCLGCPVLNDDRKQWGLGVTPRPTGQQCPQGAPTGWAYGDGAALAVGTRKGRVTGKAGGVKDKSKAPVLVLLFCSCCVLGTYWRQP